MESHAPSPPKPRWGPFTGGQLTTIACVAIVSIVVIVPTAALAAAGTFTSSSGPAVNATNSSASTGAKAIQAVESNTGTSTRYGVHGTALGPGGIGIGGAGAKYGVYSYGDLGIRSGNKLACNACVPKNAVGAGIFKNYEMVNSSETSSALSFFGTRSVACPAGKKVIGGGATVTTGGNGTESGFTVQWDGPNGENGWRADFNVSNPLKSTFTMAVYAICATVS